jgi:hypothetical protein
MPTRANDEADIVSFDIEPPLQHLGAAAKRNNWTKVFIMYQRPLAQGRRRLAHRARPGLGTDRIRDRQSVAEPATVSRYSTRANSRPLLVFSAVTLPSVSTA